MPNNPNHTNPTNPTIHLLHHLPNPQSFTKPKKFTFPKSTIINSSTSKAYHYPEHSSPIGILCNYHGNCTYRINGQPYQVDDDKFFITNFGANIEIEQPAQEGVESLFVLFSEELVADAVYESELTHELLLDNPTPLRNSVPEFIEMTHRHQGRFSAYISALRQKIKACISDELLVEYLRGMMHEMLLFNQSIYRDIDKIEVAKLSTKKEIYKRLHIAKTYMDDNFCSKISLENIAGQACFNPQHFLRLFKMYFAITPHQYLIDKRLKLARSLLNNSELSIIQICNSVGFESPGTFSWSYKKKFGHSPKQHRKLLN